MRLNSKAILSQGARLRDVNFPPVTLRLHPVIWHASSAKRDRLVHDSLGENTPNNLPHLFMGSERVLGTREMIFSKTECFSLHFHRPPEIIDLEVFHSNQSKAAWHVLVAANDTSCNIQRQSYLVCNAWSHSIRRACAGTASIGKIERMSNTSQVIAWWTFYQ